MIYLLGILWNSDVAVLGAVMFLYQANSQRIPNGATGEAPPPSLGRLFALLYIVGEAGDPKQIRGW